MYTENDLVKIAKRENNKKRNYLVVNPLQGKHIPASPQKALGLFSELAKCLEAYRNERILIVGFAETATAIGAQIALCLGAEYIQTTREKLEGVSYLYFSEEHSHASEQKLVKEDLDKVMGRIDRVIFAEDEITTGKTICNLIAAMEQCYRDIDFSKINFSVASLLNGMSEEALGAYQNRNINVHYLVKTQHDKYPQAAESAVNDGIYHERDALCRDGSAFCRNEGLPCHDSSSGETEGGYTDCLEIHGRADSRRLVHAEKYEEACEALFQEMIRRIPLEGQEKILILGTEEFMFPGLYAGKRLEERGHFVRFHAATRSPIQVSRAAEYPLHERYALYSQYEEERQIYVYDIASYDVVIVTTDAPQSGGKGARSLLNALRTKNEKVYLVRWCG